MPFKSLPSNPSLDHLKHQARDLQKAIATAEPQACQRIREFHPRFSKSSDPEISTSKFSLSDAQLTIAREYCFSSWTKLRASVESGIQANLNIPYQERITDPAFRKAVDLLDSGDEVGLSAHLRDHPQIVRQRVFFNIGDYFGNPTLLEFAAENPIRHGTLPPNIVKVVKVVLESGAGSDRAGIDRTLGLVSSGLVPRKCGVQIDLIDLLCDYGADPGTALTAAVVHGEFEAVSALLRRGAPMDLAVASAMGKLEEAKCLYGSASPEKRRLAVAYASQFGRTDVVRFLLDSGESPNGFNPVGAHSHSTPIHQAAYYGHLEVVRLLAEAGADLTVKDILFQGTPLGWAVHGGQRAVAEYLQGLAQGQ